MKGTDYDSSATPSLAQEMNLARRACWANSDCNIAYKKGDDDEEGTISIGATFSEHILTVDTRNVYIDPSYITATATNEEMLITAANEAPSSKNINNCNYNNDKNNYKSNLIKRPLTNATTAAAATTTTSTATHYLNIPKMLMNFRKRNNKNNNNNCNSDNENCPNDDGAKLANSKGDDVTTAELKMASASTEIKADAEISAILRAGQQLLQLVALWLTSVQLSDAVTITLDAAAYSKPRQSAAAAAASCGGDFRRATSRKCMYFLLLCLVFACVQRIEARPNTTAAAAGAIASSSDDKGPITTNDVTPTNLGATNDVSSMLPFVLGMEKGVAKSSATEPPAAEAYNDENSHDGETEAAAVHSHDRYPLSQVDFDRVKTPFIIGIWILSASIAKIGFHMTPKLHFIFPESCLLIVVGVIIGVVLYFCTEVAVSPLTPNTFFFYMLPPIILDAGYFMPNRMFFDNLGTILLMAVIGTIFNVATIGGSLYACGLTGIFGGPDNTPKLLDTFLFASLISAVDPVAVLAVFEEIHVNEILYIVVFGESLLNDAVTVVMYHMMEVYNEIGISNILAQDVASGVGSFFVVALGGTVIGIIWGFFTGLMTRFTDHVRVIEPIFIFVMAYLAYLTAEIFHMSGILAITFCGITMKNYVESNISIKSHTTVKYALKMLSSSSETIIFMFLGVATVNNSHVWNTAYVVLTIIFCSIFRVIGVILLTALANRFRLHKLSRVDQFVMSYGGLRGAVAFALVLLVDGRVVKQKDMFVTTTIAVIYFTVFLQGITIKPLVKFLNVKRANKRKPTMNERIHERFMDHLMAGIEDIVGKTGNYNVRDKFKRFDNRFIRPLLIRDLKGAEPKIIETYSKLTMRDAMEVMRRNPSTIGQITGTESMSALFRNYTNSCIGGSPSLTNLDNNISRNLDMQELDYNPSKKDLTDARIHHLLAEELKPYRRASIQMHRRLSYSRHAVDDRDLSTQVNYKMQMNFRRMFNDRKHHKRSKRGGNKQQDGVKQNHVSFHDFQQNGTTKQFTHDYINEILNESADEFPSKPQTEVAVTGPGYDWDDGLTFTAKSTPDSDRANNNSLIAHIQNLPGFDASKARIVQHYAPAVIISTTASSTGTATAATATTAPKAASAAATCMGECSPDRLLTPDVVQTAAELILPWRRDRSYQSFVGETDVIEEDRNVSRDSDGERRVATPTATESQLPWKRHEDEHSDAIQQNEFPAWASNKEYLAYNSPSATFLGGINKPKAPRSVIGLFRRESHSSKAGGAVGIVVPGAELGGDVIAARGSDPMLAAALNSMVAPSAATPSTSRLEKRSKSIAAPVASTLGEGHAGQFPVTASHRRNVRRGSMLELSGDIIPEETYHHGQSKSLCEPTSSEWDAAPSLTYARIGASASNSGREPLLPKLTPRTQIRKMGAASEKSQVTTALLAAADSDDESADESEHDYDADVNDEEEEEEEEEEDFELYDDENIVVTAATKTAKYGNRRSVKNADGASGSGRTQPPTTTTSTSTSIRLTRNNDESII